MKKSLLLILIIICSFIKTRAQHISRVIIAEGNLSAFIVELDENVAIYLSKDGTIAQWGFDKYAAAGVENYRDIVEPYAGRTDYYTNLDDSAYRGKLKYIGRVLLTYYASYDKEELRGKLKSIGNAAIDYYPAYENEAFRGNIKSFGYAPISWYSSYDNDALKGKLKSLGSTGFNWYSSFDDVIIRGKIKSIGNANFTWYSSFDLKDYRGSLKTGAAVQYINGIKYIVRS